MTRLYILIVSIIFSVFGVAYLFVPQPFAEFAGLMPDASGLTDMRATYGGFQMGFGLFLAWSAQRPQRYEGALLAIILVAAAVGGARLYGLAVDAAPSTFHYIGLGFEVSITVLSLLLYRREKPVSGI